MKQEREEFIYFLNFRSNGNSDRSEVRQRQATREEWEASWLSWWNKLRDASGEKEE